MIYPEDFKQEVKEVYPDYEEMHKLADNNQYFLGRYLDDSSGGGIPLDTVLTALTLEELQQKARIEKRKVNLYRRWGEIVDSQR